MGEIATGISVNESGQFVFFTAQAVGIMIEDAGMELYRRCGLKLPHRLEYAVGYLWVLLWMIFIGPYWYFPTARHMTKTWDTSMPFSVFRWLFAVLSK